MKLLIVEPYFTGSHAAWAREYAERSAHEVEILSLEGRHWKWRMHGGAVSLARRYRSRGFDPDIIIATDMLDLATFLALTRHRTADVKVACYFHENQLSYPWPECDPDPGEQRDAHYGFINYTSTLAADAVLFNSRYHRDSFLAKLEEFLAVLPDHREIDSVEEIVRKARVLPVGVDLERFDRHRRERGPAPPLILWNHRWEYDKNPDVFFEALFALQREGLEFQVAVLGERFASVPPVFEEARSRLGGRIVQCGFVEEYDTYASWLWCADVLPVTSNQEFFGVSVVQAIYCDCCPVLPNRLAYPEHIPAMRHGEFLYENASALNEMLRERIIRIDETRRLKTSKFVRHYDWRTVAPVYDALFEDLYRS